MDGPDEIDEVEARRPVARLWIVVQAALWLAVGVGTTLLIESARSRRPVLADAVDQAAVRLRKLDLSTDQQRELDAIRRRWREDVLLEERNYVERLFAAAAGADTSIQALLTDEQRSRYRELSLPASPK